jgi:hypothetical protein
VDNQHLSFTKKPVYCHNRSRFFQLEAIHDYLSQSSWAPGIDAETVRISIQNSLCFALLDGTRQIGFARLVTDYATFGYLCDVYVLNDYQRKWSWPLADRMLSRPSVDVTPATDNVGH